MPPWPRSEGPAARHRGSLLGLGALLAAVPLAGQAVTAQSDLPQTGFIDARTPIRFTVDRPPAAGERFSLLVGGQDVTALVIRSGTTLTYEPGPFPLPSGAHDVALFLVADGGAWTEVARVPIRVRGALGFQERTFAPSIDVGLKSQPAEGHDPDDLAPARATYGQLDGELRIGVDQVHEDFTVGVEARMVGTSYQQEALRFFQDQADAPKVDLASYDLRLETQPLQLTVGHLQYGSQRQLVNGVGARGARVDLGSDRIEGSFIASSTNQMVGWDNFVGFGESDDRIVSANLGLEALPTPGALRIDATWMSGRQRPLSGFNQGVISDFEESDGYGVRLRTNAIGGRVRFDAGYAESQFTNPEDDLLSQGRDLVDVAETRKSARYLDGDLDVLRGVPLWGGESARLSLGVRHERVDPLYRSVGTFVAADRLENRVDLRADISWLTLSGSLGRGEDNLDDIRSILTTRTDRTGLTAGLPLQRAGEWLPSLDYRLDRTHQEGLGVPVDGGFDESHVPDQVNTVHTVGATWQVRRVRVSLQHNVSDQDNRQPGREDADFLTRRSSIQFGVTPAALLDLGFDLTLESRDDQAAEDIARTRRWGVSVSLRPLRASSLNLSYSDTFQDNDVATFERGDRVLSAGWSSWVPFIERLGGQYFLRFNYQSSRDEDLVQQLASDRMFWTLQFGLSLSAGRR